MKLGGLEAGGTKMICAIGNEKCEILEQQSFPTGDPEETMGLIKEWFLERRPDALGIASFGPLNLDRTSPTYGNITTTPKPKWKNYPLLSDLQNALGVPATIDVDVGGAAIAEWEAGAAKGSKSCLYVTVGTGIGGALVANGENILTHGMHHPEFGHMLIPASEKDPAPNGFCPYHKGCLEGLASGKSMALRWNTDPATLLPDHIAWEIESDYLAAMCHNAVVCFSPEKIVLGGGVMKNAFLYDMVRKKLLERLGGYLALPKVTEHIEEYIVPPVFSDSGTVGALMLAKKILTTERGEN